jgi:hypothetical protein
MLKNSTKAGCELCPKMLKSSQLEEDDQMVFARSGRSWNGREIDRYGKEERDWFTFSILPLRPLMRGLAEDKNIKFEFVLAKDELDCLKMPYDGLHDIRRFPSLSPYSQECFDQIRRWQDNCIEQHIRCFRRDLPLPSRPLDLLPTTNYSNTDRITLVESRDLSKPLNKVRYVALSYCWGEWAGLVTTRGNLANMKHSIPWKIYQQPSKMQSMCAEDMEFCTSGLMHSVFARMILTNSKVKLRTWRMFTAAVSSRSPLSQAPKPARVS